MKYIICTIWTNKFCKVDNLATLSCRESFSSFLNRVKFENFSRKRNKSYQRPTSKGFLPTDGFLRQEDYQGEEEDVGLRPDEGHARPVDGNGKKWWVGKIDWNIREKNLKEIWFLWTSLNDVTNFIRHSFDTSCRHILSKIPLLPSSKSVTSFRDAPFAGSQSKPAGGCERVEGVNGHKMST